MVSQIVIFCFSAVMTSSLFVCAKNNIPSTVVEVEIQNRKL